MSLGEIISERRKVLKLSQEQLAEALSVSRSAVAKWENNHGVPDIENLKALSGTLGISIDEMLGNDINSNIDEKKTSDDYSARRDERVQKYLSKRCMVDLAGWNNGISAGYLVNQDEDFLYYVATEKKNVYPGFLAKKYVTEIAERKEKDKYPVNTGDYNCINREYFVGKKVRIELYEKRFLDGLFGGRETEYLNAQIIACLPDKLLIEVENKISEIEIPLEEITKVQVM